MTACPETDKSPTGSIIADPVPEQATQGPRPLPKLTPAEFRAYNRCAEHMNYFHNHFRQTWNTIYSICQDNELPTGLHLRGFLNTGLQFCGQLTMHHTIEEVHIFPILAQKMPKFREEFELLTHHKAIHKGVEEMEEYLGKCRVGEKEFSFGELKGVMDKFGAVLWQHLDEEVEELGAENMRKYWTVEEMRQIPM